MRKLLTLALLIGLSFAQKPTTRTPEATDYVRILDSASRGWDHTLTQIFNAEIPITGGKGVGVDLQGSYTNAAIDLTDVTLNYSGSSGPVMIRAGTYGSPVSSSDAGQSGMIRLYGLSTATSDDESSGYYDRGIFAYNRTDGSKGIFPIAGLAEVRTTSGQGPVAAMASQFIVGLHTAGAKLDSTASVTDGMFASWLKVYSVVGSVADATSRVAPVWIDNQMSGTVSGEEYGMFITAGGTLVDAVMGFETTSSGWDSFLYFDETAYDQKPVVSGDVDDGSSDYYLRVNLNGTMYGIPLYAL